MKTFSRFRTPKELKAACKKAGFPYDQGVFERGGDHVTFDFTHDGVTAGVMFNTVNGRAFGMYWRGKGPRRQWSTDSTQLEGRSWFQALLEFIYVA